MRQQLLCVDPALPPGPDRDTRPAAAHKLVLAYLLGRVARDVLRGEPAAEPTGVRRDSTEAGADRRAPWETEPVPASARGVPA